MNGCVEGRGNGNCKYNFNKLLNIIVWYFRKKFFDIMEVYKFDDEVSVEYD